MTSDPSSSDGDWRIEALQTAGIFVGVVLALVALNLILRRLMPKRRLLRQLIMLALTPLLLVPAIMAFVDTPEARFRLLGLLGVLISAAITLGSTTFIGNALAGIMLRVVDNFRLNDFIETGDLQGWVSERGLFHIEIQNEEKDLTTIPNLYLVTHPVTVIPTREETVVSADLSLGYDAPRGLVKELLQEAALEADLQKPVVRIRELGDFSVTYSVAGILNETSSLLTARSRLMGRILDAMHGGGVEIVSPSFMNTRAFDPAHRFMPQRHRAADEEGETSIEEIALEKAKTAGSIEDLEERCDKLNEAIKTSEGEVDKTDGEAERDALRLALEALIAERDQCAAEIEVLKAAGEDTGGEASSDQ